MRERIEITALMKQLLHLVSQDRNQGIARFLQANPYTSFQYYNFRILKDKWQFFEKTLYCESESSKLFKAQIIDILENPNGKNTFFLVGYQGCGKSTFIHSVINKYSRTNTTRVVVIDCDKKGTDKFQIKKHLLDKLKYIIKNDDEGYNYFIDFYRANCDQIEECDGGKIEDFYLALCGAIKNGSPYYNSSLKELMTDFSMKDLFYIIVLWNLAKRFNHPEIQKEKIMIFVDNLDCVDEYKELSEFISCIDALTVDMSELYDRFDFACDTSNDSFVDTIKLFIAMRETTKANLPTSHFSDAFRSIYTKKDMTEWYDKGEIIRKRINTLLEYDQNLNELDQTQRQILSIVKYISEDLHTYKVIYPLFNNNYRSAVDMIVKIVTNHYNQMLTYKELMNQKNSKLKHGARGLIFKYIFDEFNCGADEEESCFKRIGVIDLLNRKNQYVSICRLILSYLSNYTETKCDSGRNCVPLSEIISAFDGLFSHEDIIKILCEMFLLRDSIWTHLISFNHLDYNNEKYIMDSDINIDELNQRKTMVHYSCAGKIYVEYVATHFEFFTARVFSNRVQPLFCDENALIDKVTGNYKCCDIISRVYSEVEQCCESLKAFNQKLCSENNLLDPYENPDLYKKTPYICLFKRSNPIEGERRFKQFHEERMILAHINYIDYYRIYVLNHSTLLDNDKKVEINESLLNCLEKYVQLLQSDSVLKETYTYRTFVKHYIKQISKAQENLSDFSIEINIEKEEVVKNSETFRIINS